MQKRRQCWVCRGVVEERVFQRVFQCVFQRVFQRGKSERRQLGRMPARGNNGRDLQDPGLARVRKRYPDGSDCQSGWHQQPLGRRQQTYYACYKQQWRVNNG